jgi:hypothetical protein
VSCAALSLFLYFVFVAAYFEYADLYRYLDGNESSFFAAKREICENFLQMTPKVNQRNVCAHIFQTRVR